MLKRKGIMRFPFFLTFYSQPTDVWRGYIVTDVSINPRLHIAMKTMVGTLAVIIIMSLSSTAAYARNNVKSITAEDLVTKVYGALSPECSKAELLGGCVSEFNLSPSEEDNGMWLDSSEGYCLSYYGMIVPQVSAIASVERDSVANFGFFFLFPYTISNREDMNRRQAEFCGCLLQEMKDIGMTLAVISGSDSLFELAGDYMGNYVTVRLTDEGAGASGRYVLCLYVEPDGFTPADDFAAI